MKRQWRAITLLALTTVLGLWLFWPHKAAASTVTLTGTVKDAQGNPINGTLTMQLAVPAIDTSTSTFIPNTPVTFRLVNGSVTGGAPLLDNTNMSPAGDYYIARFTGAAGNPIATNYYVIPAGGSFNLGQAVPTTITTSNISYVNPVALNVGNIFTAAQQFALGILTDSITGITPGSTLTIAGANGMSSAGESLQFTGGNGSLNQAGGGLTFSGGNGSGTGPGAAFNMTGGAGGASSGNGGGFNLTGGAAGAGNANGGSVIISGASGTGVGVNGSISLNPCIGGTCGGSGGGGNIVLNTSIWQQGTGAKHIRAGSLCTTAPAAGAACTNVINWAGSAFANTNYSVVCMGDGITSGVPINGGITAKGTGSITFQTVAATASAAQYAVVDCWAAHD